MSLDSLLDRYCKYRNDNINADYNIDRLEKEERVEKKAWEEVERSYQACLKELKGAQKSWRGYIVKILDGKKGFLGWIHRIFQKNTRYLQEVNKQRALNGRLIEINTDLDAKVRSLRYTQANLAHFKRISVELIGTRTELEKKESVFNLVVEVCGGKEKYEGLPELNLTGKERGEEHAFGPYDISPEDMPASVMKFTDSKGYRGIAFKFKKDDNQIKCGTLYERSNAVIWPTWDSSCTLDMITGSADFIINGNKIYEQYLRNLQTLIANGKVEVRNLKTFVSNGKIEVVEQDPKIVRTLHLV